MRFKTLICHRTIVPVDFVLWHSWMCQNVVWKIVANVWSPTVKMQASGFCETLVPDLSTYKMLHQKTL